MSGVLVGFGHGSLECWRDWKRRERRCSQGAGRPEASSRAAKRRKTDGSGALKRWRSHESPSQGLRAKAGEVGAVQTRER